MASLRSSAGALVGRATWLTAALASLATVTGCSSPWAADTLRLAGDDPGAFGTVNPDVSAGQSFTFAAIPLCVSTEEEATITAVTPVNGQNLEVVAFATTTDISHTFGDGPVDLRGAGFDPTARTVTAPCPHEHTELALELRRGSTTPGSGEGFIVEYETPSGKGEMELPFEVRLCPGEVVGYECAPA